MVTDEQLTAAVHAYRGVRAETGHMNADVHTKAMRAALLAAEKVQIQERNRDRELVRRMGEALAPQPNPAEEAAIRNADRVLQEQGSWCPVPRCIRGAGHAGECDLV